MKLRLGFVANSSTATYICAICGKEETDWDWDLDRTWKHCERDHTVCDRHHDLGEDEEMTFSKCPVCQIIAKYLMEQQDEKK